MLEQGDCAGFMERQNLQPMDANRGHELGNGIGRSVLTESPKLTSSRSPDGGGGHTALPSVLEANYEKYCEQFHKN